MRNEDANVQTANNLIGLVLSSRQTVKIPTFDNNRLVAWACDGQLYPETNESVNGENKAHSKVICIINKLVELINNILVEQQTLWRLPKNKVRNILNIFALQVAFNLSFPQFNNIVPQFSHF